MGCNLRLVKVYPRVKDLLDLTSLTSVLQDGVRCGTDSETEDDECLSEYW